MPIKYIGRKVDFKGKTLWEIVGNLKNFGVGRLLIKDTHKKYPEICFYQIVRVQPLETPKNEVDRRKVMVWAEETFRGKKFDDCPIIENSEQTYYKLVPKSEEHKYLTTAVPREQVIVPRTIEWPPVLKELVRRELKKKGINQVPPLQTVINDGRLSHSRFANEGEEPTHKQHVQINLFTDVCTSEILKQIEILKSQLPVKEASEQTT